MREFREVDALVGPIANKHPEREEHLDAKGILAVDIVRQKLHPPSLEKLTRHLQMIFEHIVKIVLGHPDQPGRPQCPRPPIRHHNRKHNPQQRRPGNPRRNLDPHDPPPNLPTRQASASQQQTPPVQRIRQPDRRTQNQRQHRNHPKTRCHRHHRPKPTRQPPRIQPPHTQMPPAPRREDKQPQHHRFADSCDGNGQEQRITNEMIKRRPARKGSQRQHHPQRQRARLGG